MENGGRRQKGAAALVEFGALELNGPATREFLQGQLSNDVLALADGAWSWGGYLNAKGRLLATFICFALGPERCMLLMRRGLLDPVLKKLRMYVLRAKTRPAVSELAVNASVGAPLEGQEASAELAPGLFFSLGPAQAIDQDGGNEALLRCVEAGCPWLPPQLYEQATAHMLSLDLAGGVSLEKGCYIGQEIFIRAHHRGQAKKRAFIVAGAGKPPPPGTELLAEAHGGQVAGHVLYGARTRDGFAALATLRKDAAAQPVELADGREVRPAEPPYGLLDPQFEGRPAKKPAGPGL